MADFKPILTTETHVNTTDIPVERGQLIFTKDTGNIYIDDNTATRLSLNVYSYYLDSNTRKGIISDSSNIASGNYSYAEGYQTTASGDYSHAEGYQTVASAYQTHAEGSQTRASSDYSHAEGYRTTASSYGSHAEGYQTTASSSYSHAEGYSTTASGYYSHTEGSNTQGTGQSAHAEGYGTTAGDYSHAEGYGTTAKSYSHAEGYSSICAGQGSHSEGYAATAGGTRAGILDGTENGRQGCHAEGYATEAAGDYSHAEGNTTDAYGPNSHTEGQLTAIGESCYSSHVEGKNNFILSSQSHAEGDNNQLQQDSHQSHVEGQNNSLKGSNTHVEGTQNTTGQNGIIPSYSYTYDCHAEGIYNCVDGYNSHVEGEYNVVQGNDAHNEGQANIVFGNSSHAEGHKSIVGRVLRIPYGETGYDQTGFPTTSFSGGQNQKIGRRNYRVGPTTALRGYSYIDTTDSGHAEGFKTNAVGYSSHSSGAVTTALGDVTFTAGAYNKAIGHYSAAFGYGNNATTDCSAVFGWYGKTTELEETENLIDSSAFSWRYSISNNGSLSYNSSAINMVTTDYIDVTNFVELKIHVRPHQQGTKKGIQVYFYDENNNYLSPLEDDDYNFENMWHFRQHTNSLFPLFDTEENYETVYALVPIEARKCRVCFSWDSTDDTEDQAESYIIGYKKPTKNQLFVIGNGSDSTHRSNIVEVDNTSLTINGKIKANALNIDWAADTSYSIGDVVIQSLHLYRCNTANNDATFTAANWDQIT